MRYNNIVVPYDGSHPAKNALAESKDFLLSNPDARVYVVSVLYMEINPITFNPDPLMDGGEPILIDYQLYESLFSDEQKAAHREMIDTAHEIFEGIDEKRIECDTVIHPSVVDGIELYCQRHNCDLIIMGRRGLGGIRGILGSVSRELLSKTQLPLLTVK